MLSLRIETSKKDEILDITDVVQEQLLDVETNSGVCAIFTAHTTCAITTADLDPGTDLDFLDAMRQLIPKLKFRHPHNPSHAPDHILSSLIGASLTVPFKERKLLLGQWQRIILVELDGPRDRVVHLSFYEELKTAI